MRAFRRGVLCSGSVDPTWILSNYSYLDHGNPGAYGGRDFQVRSNGLDAYTINATSNKTIYQHGISPAWDISSITYASKSFDCSSEVGSYPRSFVIKPDDGTKLYVSSSDDEMIYQYTLSPAWDISSASYDSKSYNASEAVNLYCIRFSPDGTKLYCLSESNSYIYQYTLGTAWDISTASYASKYKDVSGIADPDTFCISNDGKHLYVGLSAATAYIYSYPISTAWDISTAGSSDGSLNIDSYCGYYTNGLNFTSDGTYLLYSSYSDATYRVVQWQLNA